jgi:radical SAM protein with 4Fe4S-binding SPASM domain
MIINLGVIDNLLGKVGVFKKYMLKNSSLGIIPSYRCDRSCGYCKYLSLSEDFPQDMTLEEFDKVLDWLERSGLKHFKFLGGEPTLYPYFKEILEITKKRNFVIDRVFSHLLFDSRLSDYFDKNIIKEIIVHFQHSYTAQEYRLFSENIRLLQKRRCNIHLKYNIVSIGESYQEFIEFSKSYGIKKVYVSLAIPGYSEDTKFASLDNMMELGRDMFELIKQLYSNGVRAFIYPVLPLCMFEQEARSFVIKNASLKGVCFGRGFISSIRINPDLSIFYCPGIARRAKKKLFDYNNLEEIHSQWDGFLKELIWRPLFDSCLDCRYFKNKYCHGGCLSYKESPKQVEDKL